ncbi:unnamed protein product [Allacma fusca]|uniref:DUF5641 domain-containing protein n=1 Tax=Allacma fusca TaxID=39272 RepID=A0A8J2J179_9HEXA|nr:unnamed protein product [Allacma fusca]
MATFLINRSFAFESGSTGPIQNQVSSQLKNEPPKSVSKGKTMERKVSAAASNGTSSESVVDVVGGNSTEKARVFIDQGSEMTLVSKEFCKRAKLVLCKNDVPISLIGITNNSIDVTQSVKCVIKSRFTDFSLAISADVINKIPYKVNRSNVSKAVEGLKYDFGETCELPYDTADILLGSEYAEFIFLDKRHFIEGLVLRESQFGYLITGSSTKCSFFGQKSSSFCGLSNLELSNQFRKFVEVEEIPDGKKEKIVEHELIDHHFESTYSIDRETNRFVVRLPLKDSVGILNGSFGKVCSMLVKSEKRRSVVVQKAYEDIFNEYLSLGHMTKISSIPDQRAYYMPHHVVSKGEDSHRIVFNASFMDNSGTSLNSHFLAGPKVQPDLVVNLIRFRWNLIGFICDIFRMYRDILIHPEDRIYQRIVFRFNFNDEIDTYELNTLANGIGPASYIAPKCLEKIATFIKDSDEIVSNILLRDLYMDNLATGSDTVADAVAINHRIYKVLLKYGFPLRKYQSNSPDFLAQISSELIDTVKVRNGKKFVMLLGLLWYLDADEIGVNIREEVLPSIVTKRVMLSVISKTFDIMGILMPITVRAKILLQELWKEGRDWDEEISIELREEFEAYCRDLVEVQSYTVPRCYFSSSSLTSTQLIGYCDASMRAACAVVYLRSIDIDGNVRVTFICSKSRLAPMKSTDIHRMELIATVLLAKLIASIRLELGVEKVYCFTDSQVALSWINIDPIKLKLFVSTRVKLVNSLVNKEHWFHIDGKLNPADLGTRGVSASKFMSLECWKNGPEILLSEDEFGRYVSDGFQVVGRVPELEVERTVSLLTYKNHHVLALLVRRSSLSICVAGLAYAIRFIRILKDKVKNRIVGTNSVVIEKRTIKELVALVPLVRMEEREDAFNNIIRASQHESFPNECDKLSKGMEIGMFEPPVDENADNLKIKSRYFLWRRIVDSFWSSWRHDYLNQLRIRSKWKTEERSLKVGDVVLIVSKDESVFEWPMGIVEQVYPDDHGLVRNVLVKSKGGGLKKSSVQNLVLLLENE